MGRLWRDANLYESPRDTAPQLERFLHSLAHHRGTLERQLEDLQAQLAEIDQHERQCRALLATHACKVPPDVAKSA